MMARLRASSTDPSPHSNVVWYAYCYLRSAPLPSLIQHKHNKRNVLIAPISAPFLTHSSLKRKWSQLEVIKLFDGQSHPLAMRLSVF